MSLPLQQILISPGVVVSDCSDLSIDVKVSVQLLHPFGVIPQFIYFFIHMSFQGITFATTFVSPRAEFDISSNCSPMSLLSNTSLCTNSSFSGYPLMTPESIYLYKYKLFQDVITFATTFVSTGVGSDLSPDCAPMSPLSNASLCTNSTSSGNPLMIPESMYPYKYKSFYDVITFATTFVLPGVGSDLSPDCAPMSPLSKTSLCTKATSSCNSLMIPQYIFLYKYR